jgi:hypothetical protein
VLSRFQYGIAVLLALGAAGCNHRAPARGVDPALAACIPSDALAAAGLDLDRLRAWPSYGKLPPGVAALLQPIEQASSALAAYNGKDVLLVARGGFRQAPQGMTLLGDGVAATGSPETVRAAAAQRRSGRPGAVWLLDRAAAVAEASPAWAVARGGVVLPFTGAAANLTQLLRLTDYAAVGIRLDDAVRLDAVAEGRDEPSALRFEENLRSMFTLAAAAGSRGNPLAECLRSAQVNRTGLTVRVGLFIPPEQVGSLLPGGRP